MAIRHSKFRKRIIFKILEVIIIVMIITVAIKHISSWQSNRNQVVTTSNQEIEQVEVSNCDISGKRKANAMVDIGVDTEFANRDYYAYTNNTKQLVFVKADKIILQNDNEEKVTSKGRYCKDEAKVQGVKNPKLDEGHVIADSLGGVSNSYNITPEDSELNREGIQADFEKQIRNASGATDFEANIKYPNKFTMIPKSYDVSFDIDGRNYHYQFKNEGSL